MTSDTETTENPATRLATVSLGAWSFYFLAKLLLFWRELIGFHPWKNPAFAAFVLLPVKSRLWCGVKNASALPLAVILLYYNSWLPAIDRVLSQTSQLSGFSLNYLIELTKPSTC